MYAEGMNAGDIEAYNPEHLWYLYLLQYSHPSPQQDLPIAKELQWRPQKPIYAMIFLDAIHHHVRSKG